jgi:peptide/nickel transport system ATP-binding protein
MDDERRELISIPGTLPNLINPPEGCRFAARCPFRTEHCERVAPPLIDVGEGHRSACHYPELAPQFRARAEERRTWNRVDADEVIPAGAEVAR